MKALSTYDKAQMLGQHMLRLDGSECSYYFDRDDVALRHMAKCLKEQSHEQKEHAELFLTYQNKKAGCIKPEQDEWGNSPEALQCALQLEEAVNQVLVDLLKLATEKNDPHVKAIKQLRDHVTNLKHLEVSQNNMGEYQFGT
ncbi:unnamed protein product [Caretta caretta]